MTQANLSDRVAAGAKLLNEQCPDWRTKIDQKSLKIQDTELCILGQLGGYDEFLAKHQMIEEQAVLLGFSASGFSIQDYHRQKEAWDQENLDLKKAWIKEIQAGVTS